MRFASQRTGLVFEGNNFSGRGGENIGQAGGMSTLPKTFATFRNKAPRYDEIGRYSIAAENAKWRAAEEAKASIAATGLAYEGRVKAAEIEADAYKKAADKAGKSAMLGAGIGAIGSV